MSKSTENTLIEIEGINLPVITEIVGKVHDVYTSHFTKIEEEIANHVPDISTESGRKEIKSLAYKISRTKTGLDDAGAKLTADQKSLIDGVNSERKEMRDTLDGMRDKVKAPLVKWEADEDTRIKKSLEIFNVLNSMVESVDHGTSEEVFSLLTSIADFDLDEDILRTRHEEAYGLRSQITKDLNDLLARKTKEEADQAELEELREAKRKQEEMDQEREAEAERAELKRLVEIKQAEAQKLEEERMKEAAERAAKAAKEEAEKAAQEKIDAANQEAEDAKQAAIKQKEDSDLKAKEALDQAEKEKAEALRLADKKVEDERIANQKAETEFKEAQDARAKDIKRRNKITEEISDAILKCSDCSEAQAEVITLAIGKGKIPHIKISF